MAFAGRNAHRAAARFLLAAASGLALLSALAQPLPIPGAKPEAASSPAAAPAVYDREEIRKALAAAKAQLEGIETAGEAPADAPANTPASEIAERLSLARQLVSIHQQQLEALDRAAEGRRIQAETTRARESWRGFPTPPPRSVLLLDALRDERDAANHAIAQARARIALFERIDATYAGKVKASQAAARLAIEAVDAARGTPQSAEREWQRALAVLRGAVDSATQGLLQLGVRGAQAEVEAAEARSAFAQQKLADAGTQLALPREDLDKVLADLDARRRATERELERAGRAAAAAIEALTLAERRLAGHPTALTGRSEAREAEASRAAELALDVAARREASATATQRVYLLREFLLQLDGERAVWEARAQAIGEQDPVRARAVHERLTQSLAGVRTARQYLEQQHESISGRIRDEETRQRRESPAEAEASRRLLDALRTRERDLRHAIDNSQRLDRLLSRFRSDFEERRDVSLAERVKDTAAAALLAAGRVWQFELFTIDDTLELADGRKVAVSRSVTVGKSFGAALIVALGYWLASLAVRRIERLVVARGRVSPQAAGLVRNWILFAIAAILAILALVSASIPLTAFAFLGGALAIAAGFGLQNLLKNLVSGVMLLVERPLRLGDLVEVDGIRGRITEIGIRASTIRAVDGIESMIPNSRLVEGNVTNWTYSSPTTRQSVAIGVAYGTPLERAGAILGGALSAHPLVLRDPAPQVYLEEFGDSAVNFALTYWVEMTPDSDARRVKSDLLFAIDRAFADAGIAIPFPQRDIHLDVAGPVPVAIVPHPPAGGSPSGGPPPPPCAGPAG